PILPNSKLTHARADNPFIRRRHGPHIGPSGHESLHEFAHLGENARRNPDCVVFVGSTLHVFFAQAVVHRYHFAAHDFFGYFALAICGVTSTRPARNIVGDESTLHAPGKKTFARVSRPEGAIAIEGGNMRFAAKDTFDELSLVMCKLSH